MTVQELIDKLAFLNPNAIVVREDYEWGTTTVEKVKSTSYQARSDDNLTGDNLIILNTEEIIPPVYKDGVKQDINMVTYEAVMLD
jgi:hypothetical protein